MVVKEKIRKKKQQRFDVKNGQQMPLVKQINQREFGIK